MIERIRDLVERFPEDEGTVSDLMCRDETFGSLCREYDRSGRELGRFDIVGGSVATAEANWLKQRRSELEQEILAKIEGYRPI